MNMRSLAQSLIRLILGGLFIFSGVIKMNDPLGFSYKLEEYFGADVFNLEFLQPLALPMAVFLVTFEVVLGLLGAFGQQIGCPTGIAEGGLGRVGQFGPVIGIVPGLPGSGFQHGLGLGLQAFGRSPASLPFVDCRRWSAAFRDRGIL